MTVTWVDVLVIAAGGAVMTQAIEQMTFSWWRTAMGVAGLINIVYYVIKAAA